MFNTGDRVRIDDEFAGNVVVAGWNRQDIELYTFEVVTFDDYQKVNPSFAQTVKTKPSAKGEIFLRYEDEVFVMSPPKALILVRAAPLVCNCPINRLWAGNGHAAGCPEFPPT